MSTLILSLAVVLYFFAYPERWSQLCGDVKKTARSGLDYVRRR